MLNQVGAKICRKCGKEKTLGEFYRSKSSADGFRGQCKKCKRLENENFRESNKEYFIAYAKTHRRRVTSLAAKWRTDNPEKVKESKRKYKNNFPEKTKEQERRYRLRTLSLPGGQLHQKMSHLVHRSLKGKTGNGSWSCLVGYDLKTLRRHLERLFTDGMTWGNIGKWHIDHIIPRRAFNFENHEDPDFKRCWALKNLQPLWALENLKKSGKLQKPFQPMLRLRMP